MEHLGDFASKAAEISRSPFGLPRWVCVLAVYELWDGVLAVLATNNDLNSGGDAPVMAIQIKICAEYRDMLPRPRLVCQEPGLRPIGRSPGVPDKSSRGLGSMSRYSAQILICFIAYIFSIFNFSVGLVGNLAELPPCTVPPATVHCYQNEAAQCSSDNQISQHALLRGSRKKHSLAFMPQNWWN